MKDNSLLCTDKGLAEMYQRNVDMVYRICYMYLKNTVDAEDAVQSVFLKLLKSHMTFNDYEHEKAWLIITAKNYCKDIFKSWWKRQRVDFDSLPEIATQEEDTQTGEVLAKLLALPEKYRIVLHLHYFEDYSVKEISELLGSRESTIRTQLLRGRERLKIDLGGKSFGKKDCKANI